MFNIRDLLKIYLQMAELKDLFLIIGASFSAGDQLQNGVLLIFSMDTFQINTGIKRSWPCLICESVL